MMLIMAAGVLGGFMWLMISNENIKKQKQEGKYRVDVPWWLKEFIQESISEKVRSLIIYSIVAVVLFAILTCIQQFTYIGAVTVTTAEPSTLLLTLAGISICTMIVLTSLPLLIVFGAWMILIAKWLKVWELKTQWQQNPLEVVIRNKHRRKDGRLLEDL